LVAQRAGGGDRIGDHRPDFMVVKTSLHEHAMRLLALAISTREEGNIELSDDLTLRSMQILDRAEAGAERQTTIQQQQQIYPPPHDF
jgi:hypothetical protein